MERLRGRRIIVTGAAGSIGSATTAALLQAEGSALLAIDTNESGLYELSRELATARLQVALVDITDSADIARCIRAFEPDVVFHIAGYKHVPLLESQVLPALRTNVLGSANVLAAAAGGDVARVVVLSSDKAVAPISVLGRTKRIIELLTTAYAYALQRPWPVVRLGNVLGSAGSVLPVLRAQLTQQAPLTVTHPDMARYFMSIGQAVELLFFAAAFGECGDLLLFDMGSPVRILDLARLLIGIAGGSASQITFTGLRPGERLHERLWYEDERPIRLGETPALRARMSETVPLDELLTSMQRLDVACAAGQLDQAKGIAEALLARSTSPVPVAAAE